MDNFLRLSKLLCFLSLAAFLIVAIVKVVAVSKSVQSLVSESQMTVTSVRNAADGLRAEAVEQMARLKDPRNSKAIDAAIQTAAVYNGTGRLINTQVIPRTMKVLDELSATIAEVRQVAENTDKNINQGMLPATTETIMDAGVSLITMNKALEEASVRSNIALDDIHRLLSDPSWARAVSNIADISQHAAEVSAQAAEASKQMPSIAASLESIVKTSSRLSKFVIIANIFSLIARAF